MNTLAGVIGSGKSSLTTILSQDLNTKAFYEPVENNPVLPLFYQGNKAVESGKSQTNPYAFLLQIYFLNKRFALIKKAMQENNSVLDRSIYEDAIFMKMNYEQGHTTKTEWDIYLDLLSNMLEELPYAAHKKAPDLMIWIKVSYDTMLTRIKKRGRKFEQIEQDPSLIKYYHDLIKYYQQWAQNYQESPLIIIDGDRYNFMENVYDKNTVLEQIEQKLVELNKLSSEQFQFLHAQRLLKSHS